MQKQVWKKKSAKMKRRERKSKKYIKECLANEEKKKKTKTLKYYPV